MAEIGTIKFCLSTFFQQRLYECDKLALANIARK